MARYVNQLNGSEVIPKEIIDRAPSAELREGQKDEDSLPPYKQLDAVLRTYVDRRESIVNATAGFATDKTIEHVIRLIRRNEYKRRQSPLGPKVSGIAFGRDWRYPITGK